MHCFTFAHGSSVAQLPRYFPNRSTVQRYFYTWWTEGLWERVNFLLVQHSRERGGREASPLAGVIDSQSVKTTESFHPDARVDEGKRPNDSITRLRRGAAPTPDRGS